MYVYIYSHDDLDAGDGLCGPLPLISCTHVEEANGASELNGSCAYDADGKWTCLTAGAVIKAYVQMRAGAQRAASIAAQFFDVVDVKRGNHEVTFTARHVFYRLLGNVTTFAPAGAKTPAQLLAGLLAGCEEETGFTAATNVAGSVEGYKAERINPVKALLDPEAGLAALIGAELARDNFSFSLLGAAGVDAGVRIEPGKNLVGCESAVDISNVATHILPVGENKNGDPLFLPERLIASDYAALYPAKKIHVLTVKDAKVGKDGMTQAQACDRMREEAQALLDSGADQPEVTLSVEVAQLSGAAGMELMELLEPLCLYDHVTVLDPSIGVNQKMQVVRREWDCLSARMDRIELGTPARGMTGAGVASWQIPSGISGSKLTDGSVSSRVLQNDAVTTRHLQAESINADKLQAGSVTAQKLDADTVNAAMIAAQAAHLESITSETILTDRLAAALAEITVLAAGAATFDAATVRHLVAEAMSLEFGQAGTVSITNLLVDTATILSANVGNLCVQSAEGDWYKLTVDGSGTVTAQEYTPTASEIRDGVTTDGRPMVATEIVADDLSTDNLFATYVLTHKIDAAQIDVDQLWARAAFLGKLYTSDIVAQNTGLRIALETVTGAAASAAAQAQDAQGRIEAAEADIEAANDLVSNASDWFEFRPDGFEVGRDGSVFSTVTDNTGFHIRSAQRAEPVSSFDVNGLRTASLQLGRIRCKSTSTGGWAWQEVTI